MALTNEEAVRYDRQVRLWGIDAQLKMMKSKVAVVNMGGLGSEIAKNLVLGGVGELVVVDEKEVEEADLGVNFLLAGEGGGKVGERCLDQLKGMNAMVKLSAVEKISESDLSGFTCIVATDMTKQQATTLNNSCRAHSVALLLCNSHGMLSFSFSDFGDAFTVTLEDPTNKTIKTSHTTAFTPLSAALSTSWVAKKPLKSFIYAQTAWEANLTPTTPDPIRHLTAASKHISKTHGTEELSPAEIEKIASSCVGTFPPISAVAGGVYAQEVLKVLHLNAKPVNNFFVYDGLDESKGYAEKI